MSDNKPEPRFFKFVGDHKERIHPEDMDHVSFGLDFSGGAAVKVTNEAILAKLENNGHYREVKSAKSGVKTTKQAAAEKADKE